MLTNFSLPSLCLFIEAYNPSQSPLPKFLRNAPVSLDAIHRMCNHASPDKVKYRPQCSRTIQRKMRIGEESWKRSRLVQVRIIRANNTQQNFSTGRLHPEINLYLSYSQYTNFHRNGIPSIHLEQKLQLLYTSEIVPIFGLSVSAKILRPVLKGTSTKQAQKRHTFPAEPLLNPTTLCSPLP